jgi:hypothetical protein
MAALAAAMPYTSVTWGRCWYALELGDLLQDFDFCLVVAFMLTCR